MGLMVGVIGGKIVLCVVLEVVDGVGCIFEDVGRMVVDVPYDCFWIIGWGRVDFK